MANYLVTGGTGFIGGALVPALLDDGHTLTIFTRRPRRHADTDKLRYIDSFDAIADHEVFDVVINLGGEGIGDKRWSPQRKRELFDSRVELTRDLVACLTRLQHKPAVMINGSAIGWYGASDDRPLDENASYHDEFTHSLCRAWENAAGLVTKLGVRLCIVRQGVVLGRGGGALKRMLPPFYIGLGGPLGSGEQMMSWVHMTDLLKAYRFLIDNAGLSGVFNLTAPNAVTNRDFARAIGRALRRPAVVPVPGFVLKVVFGEMADRLLLHGQRVIPRRLQDNGFAFDFPDIDAALFDILRR